MTPEDMSRIVRLAHVEANRTPEDLALLLAVWWEHLGTYPASDVQARVLQFMAESSWPPKVSQILDLLNGTDPTSAGNARAAVMAFCKAGRFHPGKNATPSRDEYPNAAAHLAAREIGSNWNSQSEAWLAKAFDEAYARHATNLAREVRQSAVALAAGNGTAGSLEAGDR